MDLLLSIFCFAIVVGPSQEQSDESVVLRLHPCREGNRFEQGWNNCNLSTGECECSRECFWTHMVGLCNFNIVQGQRCKMHKASPLWAQHMQYGIPVTNFIHSFIPWDCVHHNVEFLDD